MLAPAFQTTLSLTRAADLPVRQWPGGTTTELFRVPVDSPAGTPDFAVRVSAATVERDGPFTRYEGYTRHLVLVGGAGMQLQIDGATHSLGEPSRYIQFQGSAPTEATLIDGPVRDFNIIHRADVEATLQALTIGSVFSTIRPTTLAPSGSPPHWREEILWSPHGTLEVEMGRERVVVAPGDVFRIHHNERTTSFQLRCRGDCCTAFLASLAIPKSLERR